MAAVWIDRSARFHQDRAGQRAGRAVESGQRTENRLTPHKRTHSRYGRVEFALAALIDGAAPATRVVVVHEAPQTVDPMTGVADVFRRERP